MFYLEGHTSSASSFIYCVFIPVCRDKSWKFQCLEIPTFPKKNPKKTQTTSGLVCAPQGREMGFPQLKLE